MKMRRNEHISHDIALAYNRWHFCYLQVGHSEYGLQSHHMSARGRTFWVWFTFTSYECAWAYIWGCDNLKYCVARALSQGIYIKPCKPALLHEFHCYSTNCVLFTPSVCKLPRVHTRSYASTFERFCEKNTNFLIDFDKMRLRTTFWHTSASICVMAHTGAVFLHPSAPPPSW